METAATANNRLGLVARRQNIYRRLALGIADGRDRLAR
jgi:hypothetical protein